MGAIASFFKLWLTLMGVLFRRMLASPGLSMMQGFCPDLRLAGSCNVQISSEDLWLKWATQWSSLTFWEMLAMLCLQVSLFHILENDWQQSRNTSTLCTPLRECALSELLECWRWDGGFWMGRCVSGILIESLHSMCLYTAYSHGC